MMNDKSLPMIAIIEIKSSSKQPERRAAESSDYSLTQPLKMRRSKINSAPIEEKIRIENEQGLSRKNPSWPLVEKVINELDEGWGNSFACLSKPGSTYIQCMRGFNGWHLEARITWEDFKEYTHLRACYPAVLSKSEALKKHDFVSDGKFCDLLKQEDVIAAFRAFYSGETVATLMWRRIDV